LIAFSRQGPSQLDRIYVVEPNGHGLRALTSARLDAVDPVWSPNGKQIAYIAGQSDRLYVMNPDGSHKHLVSNGGGPLGGATRPTWSPDGKRLLFYVTTFAGHALYVVDADGTHLHRLSGVDSYYPAWSPRGDLIAVTLRGNRIAELNATGAEVRTLTHPGFCAQWPTWSPDGKKIAYAVSRGSCANPSSIHVVNVDGGDDKALTHHRFGTFDQSPAWSPDGNEIAFQCAGGPIFGAICVLKLSNPTSIRFAAGTPFGRDFDPSWQPLTG
jgi:TolB protein